MTDNDGVLLAVFCSNGAHSKEGRGRGLEAPDGQGCPACNCYVYHADQVRDEPPPPASTFTLVFQCCCRSSLKGGSGIKNVSSVAGVPGSWTPGLPVMVLTTSFTATVVLPAPHTGDLQLHVVSACYRKVHGIKGYGFGQGGPALLSGDALESVESVPATTKVIDTTAILADDQASGCPRCGGK